MKTLVIFLVLLFPVLYIVIGNLPREKEEFFIWDILLISYPMLATFIWGIVNTIRREKQFRKPFKYEE
jgi:hypothetical protein